MIGTVCGHGPLGGLAEPKAFASDHSRFLYFHREDRRPYYGTFDDWLARSPLLSGLLGSGKDTWLASKMQPTCR